MKSTNFFIYFLVLTLMLIALTGCGPAQAEILTRSYAGPG